MKRREFAQWASLGLVASSLPVALTACTDPDADQYSSLGTLEELENAGYLINEEETVLVVKDNIGKLMAVNPVCTHRGCIVEWRADKQDLFCPCHKAKFAPNGEVLAKPAPTPLPTYKVKTDKEQVLVKLT